ncbi:helix-turn-helix transcriptional regulator [Nostocoides australiense]
MSDPALAAALLSSPVRRQIVDAIAGAQAARVPGTGAPALGAEGLSAAQVAKAVDLHVTTARFHLDQLVAAGVLVASFHKHPGAGRPRKVYAVTRRPVSAENPEVPTGLLMEVLAGTLSAGRDEGRVVEPDEAGRRWALENVPAHDASPAHSAGEFVGKVGSLIDVLQHWGYEPELSTRDQGRSVQIDLPHCPFRGLARRHTDVVCGIHRGLIAGTMDRLGEPNTTVTLLPFAEGGTCIAHISRTTPFDPAEPQPRPTDPDRKHTRKHADD